MESTCKLCGIELTHKQVLFGNSYCSRKCYIKSTIGRTSPMKGVKGVFKANSGSFKKGQTSPRKGKGIIRLNYCLNCEKQFRMINRTQRFCSKSCAVKYRKKGQILKSPINKLIRGSPKYKEWRLMVFGRDDFTCQNCGKRGCYLEAHHIKSFARYIDERFNVDNGITYCKACHLLLDKNRGKRGKQIKNVINREK